MLAQAPTARETKLAKSLVHPEKAVRDRTVQTLTSYVSTLSGLDDKEMMKLWKALYYCMWLADKSEVQLELAHSLAGLVDKMNNEELQITYFRNFFRIMLREWSYLDQYRVNKFYSLIRVVMNKIFTIIAHKNFDHGLLRDYCTMINDEILKRLPNGIRYHMCDIFFAEFAKVGGENIATSTLLVALEPFFDSVTRPLEEGPFVDRVYRSVFTALLTEQADSFPNMKWTVLQKKVFDLASAEETPERHRKKLYDLHKQCAVKTAVQFVMEDEPEEQKQVVKSKKEKKAAKAAAVVEETKAVVPVVEKTESTDKKSKKRKAEEEEAPAPVATKKAEPEPVVTKAKEAAPVATETPSESKKKQKKEKAVVEEPVKEKAPEPVKEKSPETNAASSEGKKKKDKAAKQEEAPAKQAPPAKAEEPAAEVAKPEFVESKKFAGAKAGYIFQKVSSNSHLFFCHSYLLVVIFRAHEVLATIWTRTSQLLRLVNPTRRNKLVV